MDARVNRALAPVSTGYARDDSYTAFSQPKCTG
jgi:hypothetical protein